MIEYDFGEYCSGCGACENICPFDAIKMNPDNDGFYMPVIDRDKCKNCGKCDKVCPHLNKDRNRGDKSDIKAVWLFASGNDDAKMRSSSGAACFELGSKVIEDGGSVAGCIWDETLSVKHGLGNDMSFLIKTQGSKYVQSKVGSVYKDAADKLREGRKVLFTGTPCQGTAMHNYLFNSSLDKYRDNLITLAVICHGVASPFVWDSFKEYSKKITGSPLVSVNFRDKSQKGYKKSYCHYEYADGRSIYLPTYLPSSKYIEASLVYNLAIRNSCTHCDCKGINTGIDLIVGDWYAAYKGEGKLGTSCIVAFTDRGKKYAEEALNGLRIFDYESVLRDNSFIEKSIKKAEKRDKFFERIKDVDYWDKVEELYPPKYKYKKILVKIGLYGILKKFIG